MRKINILALIFSVSLLLNSCGEYQRIAGKGTMLERYKLAVKKYEAKEYSKALRLFELVTPSYRGKPQMERIQFMVAQSNFNEKIMRQPPIILIDLQKIIQIVLRKKKELFYLHIVIS